MIFSLLGLILARVMASSQDASREDNSNQKESQDKPQSGKDESTKDVKIETDWKELIMFT
jgi:hypothetical protein